ncbi:MAG: PAS domain S-box protein [Bacillota bacterium]|nr:PAS domain S-box protein [Bacillota bacterium]
MTELFEKIVTNQEWIKDKSISNIMEKLPLGGEKYIDILCNFADLLVNAMIRFQVNGRIEDIGIIQELVESYVLQIATGFKSFINIESFLLIVKCYKKAFVQILSESSLGFSCKNEHLLFVEEFFDELEIIVVRELSKANQLETKFNTLTHISSALIFINDGFKFNYVNPAVEEFSGYTKEEIFNMGLWDNVHPDSKKQLIEYRERQQEGLGDERKTVDVKITAKNGEEKWVQVNYGSILINDKLHYIGIAFDITNKKLAEIKLKKNEELYRCLIDCVPHSVIVYCNGHITYVNQSAIDMFKLESLNKVKGKRIFDFMQPDKESKQIIKAGISMLKEKGMMYTPNVKLIAKTTNELMECEITATTSLIDNVNSTLCVIRNLEEKRKYEELAYEIKEKTKQLNETIEYNKIRTEFLANISHELRTPLNVITSSLQLLELLDKERKTDLIKEKLHSYTSMMRNNCLRLSRIINNIIDMAQMGNGYSDIRLSNKDIVKVIEDITILCAEYADKRGINLVFDTDVEECYMAFDQQKIERVILNLLSNSFKFTRPGGSIFVNIYNKNNSIDISVKDDGIGIPYSKQSEIFDVFVQVDKSFTRTSEGSGIGLSIVKALVEMHKGSVKIKSEEYKGTECIVNLPIIYSSVGDMEFDYEEYNLSNCKDKVIMEFSDIYEF